MSKSGVLLALIFGLTHLAGAQGQEKRFVAAGSSAGRRVALVVGNRDYRVRPLTNPLNDADDMAAALRQLEFNVTVLKNANYERFRVEVDSFAQSLQEGDIVFFYYSGHGIAFERQNYLIPIDFNATSQAAVKFYAVPADYVQTVVEDHKPKMAIFVLDACRDNPFIRTKGAGTSGLAPAREAKGTLVAFAAGEGEAALDNEGERNSLYTKYLLRALNEPGLPVRDLFHRVKEQVHEASGQKILPSVQDSLFGEFVFRPPNPEDEARLQSERARKDDDMAWTFARAGNSKPGFEQYLKQFPNGAHAAEAVRLRNQLESRDRDEALKLEQRREEDAWRVAQAVKSRGGYQYYLAEFPRGTHAAEANRSIAALDATSNSNDAARLRDDQSRLWNFVLEANSRSAVDLYLQQFPNGIHSSEAIRLRDRMVATENDARNQESARLARQMDDSAWAIARNTASRTGFAAYLRDYPAGAHSSEARDLMSKIPEAGLGPTLHQPRRNPKDKSDYIWIPGGTFEAGCANERDCETGDPRRHTVTIPEEGFWIGQTEVTVNAYLTYAEENKVKMPGSSSDNSKWAFTDHPMIKVSWEEAQDFCRWVGGRLPNGDEWERAARGGANTPYPWGATIQRNQAKYIDSVKTKGVVTAPVKSFDPNGYGLYDVSGNVWEWVTETDANGLHLARGGSWYSVAKHLQVTSVHGFTRSNQVGFRCLLPARP
jgi:formylglycine-generating enzyme required for sulfatase activity